MKTLKTLLMTLCLAGAVHAEAKTVSLNFSKEGGQGRLHTLSTSSVDGGTDTWRLTLGNPEALASLKVGDELVFDRGRNEEGSFHLVLVDEEWAGPVKGWRAAIEGVECAAVYRGPSGWYIDVNDMKTGLTYQIREVSGSNVWQVTQMDPNREPTTCLPPKKPDMSMLPRLSASSLSTKSVRVNKDEILYIDLLYAFEGKAKKWVENTKMMTLDEFAFQQIAKANGVIANTDLGGYFRFRYAGTTSITNECADLNEALDNVTGLKEFGKWQSIRDARDRFGADIVCMMIDTGSAYGGTGLAWGLGIESSNPTIFGILYAYNAVSVRAAYEHYTSIHEIGHNLGAGHSNNQESGGAGPQLYDYSSGYYFTGKDDNVAYYTVMAYNYNYKKYYTQAPYFSSPDYSYKGTAVGTKDKNDNNRTIRETYEAASGWMHPRQSLFGPSARWDSGRFVDKDSIDGFVLDLNGNTVDESGAIVLDKGPIFIDTPLDTSSEGDGHEITVVAQIENVDTSKTGTIVSFNIGGNDDYYANHAGLGFADGGSVSGIYKGAWPWTDWKDFANYPGDKSSHMVAFSCAWNDGPKPGSGGYYGAMMALDGKVVGSCDKMEDSEKKIVKRVAVGGRNGMTPMSLVGAKITYLAVYTGAISPERLAEATSGIDWNVPVISKEGKTLTWSVDTTKAPYSFTATDLVDLDKDPWKVTLKSASGMGATIEFGARSVYQAAHYIIESGTHRIQWLGNAKDMYFDINGKADDPSILVKPGATLDFIVKDITGWQGSASDSRKKGNLIRINGGGTLNLLQVGTETHYYQGRYWLDPGATVSADFSDGKFRLNGGATKGYEQLYVPDTTNGAPIATFKVSHKLNVANDATSGLGIFVGNHATLCLDADITSDGKWIEKWGEGLLTVKGSLADFTGTLAINAGALKLEGVAPKYSVGCAKGAVVIAGTRRDLVLYGDGLVTVQLTKDEQMPGKSITCFTREEGAISVGTVLDKDGHDITGRVTISGNIITINPNPVLYIITRR